MQVRDVRGRLGMVRGAPGIDAPRAVLLVPLVFRGRSLGALAAFEKLGADTGFAPRDEALLESFAASAATAVATAMSVAEERLRDSLRAQEAERARWARELHDETLQGLGALRLTLSAALRHRDERALRATVREALGALGEEIDELRALITSRSARPPAPRGAELVRTAGDADLLVCGSRGYGPLRSVLLGDVSRHLVEHARCPVLVVRRAGGSETAQRLSTAVRARG